MRMDKLTNPLQQALGDAQSLAVGRDHSMIEPAHLLSALINQSGSAILPLLQKAGANISVLHAGVDKALSKVAKLADSTGDVQGSQALGRLLNRADKLSQERGDAYISSDVVLLAMGSANPVAYRLIHMTPEIDISILSNPIFNQDVMRVFRPAWFRTMLQQVITSKSGLHVAAKGIKLLARRDPVSFYKHIFQGHPEDIAYVEANPDDYKEAGKYLIETDASLLYYDALMCLRPDPLLKDTYFDGRQVVVLVGEHSGEYWKDEMEKEANRLGLPLVFAPHGDLFSGYASPSSVIDIVERYRGETQVSQ